MNTDTPETDAACEETYAQGVAHIPLVGFMEMLERERDEARATIGQIRNLVTTYQESKESFIHRVRLILDGFNP